MTKGFNQDEPNPLFEWPGTTTALQIVAQAGSKTRERAKEVLTRGFVWFRVRSMDMHAVVPGSGDREYLLWADFLEHEMNCECDAFKHQPGACKHLVAAILRMITRKEPGETTEVGWMRSTVKESRNAGTHRKPWEKRASFDPEIAKEHGAHVSTRKLYRKEVECYVLDNDLLWTGPLPVPDEGDMVIAYLPTGSKVPARVIEHVSQDNGFLGLRVKMGDTPKGFSSDTIVIMGSEVERNDGQIQETRTKRESA